VDFKSKKQIYHHKFDRREELDKKSAAEVPVMLSKILEEELRKVINAFYRIIE